MTNEHHFENFIKLPLEANESMGKEMVQILLQKRPEFAQFYNADGTLKSEPVTNELSAEEQLEAKLRAAKEMYKNPRKPGSPGLPPVQVQTTQEPVHAWTTAEPVFSPTKSGTLTSIFSSPETYQYTKPNIDLAELYPPINQTTEKPKVILPGELEKAKREKIDFLLQTFSKIYQRQGCKFLFRNSFSEKKYRNILS